MSGAIFLSRAPMAATNSRAGATTWVSYSSRFRSNQSLLLFFLISRQNFSVFCENPLNPDAMPRTPLIV